MKKAWIKRVKGERALVITFLSVTWLPILFFYGVLVIATILAWLEAVTLYFSLLLFHGMGLTLAVSVLAIGVLIATLLTVFIRTPKTLLLGILGLGFLIALLFGGSVTKLEDAYEFFSEPRISWLAIQYVVLLVTSLLTAVFWRKPTSQTPKT